MVQLAHDNRFLPFLSYTNCQGKTEFQHAERLAHDLNNHDLNNFKIKYSGLWGLEMEPANIILKPNGKASRRAEFSWHA